MQSQGNLFRNIINNYCVPNINGFTCVIWESASIVSMALQGQNFFFEFWIVYFYKSNQNVNFCLREISSVCQHNFVFSMCLILI